ncbi:MAG: DUF4386 family protein [Chloroflexi bacterium]|jgi:hypothetical protein|nr:DUF4386 family protein [Chloroflexota bacterium]
MNIETNTVRLLGVAQVLVFVSFLITEGLQATAVGSGSMSDILLSISKRLSLMRISGLAALGQTIVIIALGVLYFVVFYEEYKIIALMALGCILLAAITFTVGKIGANALIPLSQEFVEAGAPDPSYFQTLGDFLYNGVDKRGSELYALFIALGFLLTTYLLYISRSIPRAISIFGLVALCLFLIYQVLQLYERDLFPTAQYLALPYVPY